MGKSDFLTPKAIGNRIKAKGLQKLRWYCQMCQKQCRDENGFKCHLSSESHKRQMMVFGEAPDRVIEGYSEEFEESFLEHLRMAHPFSRVAAKVVYNEFIADKHHVHMNSTKWLTLTEFVKYLGREGKCKVDETPKGWFISLIRRDEAGELESERKGKRERAEREEEERHQREIELQIERAQKMARTEEAAPASGSELQRDEAGQPLSFAMPAHRLPASSAAPRESAARPAPAVFAEDAGDGGDQAREERSGAAPGKPKSKLELLMEQDKARQAAAQARAGSGAAASAVAGGKDSDKRTEQPWLLPGLIVKVLSKELAEHGYYKKKGRVTQVVRRFVGVVEMLDSGDVLQVDQAQLETVIPQAGGTVMVVGGAHRGARGTMVAVNVDKFQAQVQLSGGQQVWLEYEDVCKLDSAAAAGAR